MFLNMLLQINDYSKIGGNLELMWKTNEDSIFMLRWNKAYQLANKSHVTSINQSECIISV